MFEEKLDISETHIKLKTDLKKHYLNRFILGIRKEIIDFSRLYPEFLTSIEPVELESDSNMINIMLDAGLKADVGPMASVAGSISELCLDYLINNGSKYSIIDNGGDIAIFTNKKSILGLYSGKSELSGKIGFLINKNDKFRGVCTSSGTVGHSISFGVSDSVTVFSNRASVSDALATSIGNYANGGSSEDIVNNCLSMSDRFKKYYYGVMVVVDGYLGVNGTIPELVHTCEDDVFNELIEI